MDLVYTLISDGSSDRVLMPFLSWLIEQHIPQVSVQGQWADFRHLKQPPIGLQQRMKTAIDLYPCQLIFVHRDAENMSATARLNQIKAAKDALEVEGFALPVYFCCFP